MSNYLLGDLYTHVFVRPVKPVPEIVAAMAFGIPDRVDRFFSMRFAADDALKLRTWNDPRLGLSRQETIELRITQSLLCNLREQLATEIQDGRVVVAPASENDLQDGPWAIYGWQKPLMYVLVPDPLRGTTQSAETTAQTLLHAVQPAKSNQIDLLEPIEYKPGVRPHEEASRQFSKCLKEAFDESLKTGESVNKDEM